MTVLLNIKIVTTSYISATTKKIFEETAYEVSLQLVTSSLVMELVEL